MLGLWTTKSCYLTAIHQKKEKAIQNILKMEGKHATSYEEKPGLPTDGEWVSIIDIVEKNR